MSLLKTKTKEEKTPSVGKDVEWQEPSHTVGGNVNWYKPFGKLFGSLHCSYTYASRHISNICPHIPKTCARMFVATLIAQHWKQPTRCWKRSLRGCDLPVDSWAGPRQSEAPQPLPWPWNVRSAHASHSGTYFKDTALRKSSVVETIWTDTWMNQVKASLKTLEILVGGAEIYPLAASLVSSLVHWACHLSFWSGLPLSSVSPCLSCTGAGLQANTCPPTAFRMDEWHVCNSHAIKYYTAVTMKWQDTQQHGGILQLKSRVCKAQKQTKWTPELRTAKQGGKIIRKCKWSPYNQEMVPFGEQGTWDQGASRERLESL